MTKKFDWHQLKNNFYLHFAFLLVVIFALVGKKPPFDNEYAYLLRLVTTYNGNFLLNDVTFSAPANEHWVFNHLFGLLTFVFSIEFISWSGRIVCWAILLFALMRVAKQWEIPLWMTTASIFLWLCLGQSVVGEEWIFGTFEAKCIAYICLLFALDGFCREKFVYPAILLGLTFCFHPAVGLWSILAVGAALLICRRDLPKLLIIGGLTAVFALPALLPMLTETAKAALVDDWKFVELIKLPALLDPFSWSKSGVCLVFLQLAFCLLFYRANLPTKRRQFLTMFLTALGLFFAAGFVLRGLGQYELLVYMPTRLFPVFAPLFFLFTFAEAFERKFFAPPLTTLAVVALACLLLWQSPLKTATDQVVQNYRTWSHTLDDEQKTFVWLRENTPNGVNILAPPWRKDFWYYAQRAQVVNSGYPPFADLHDWRERIELLTGDSLNQTERRENDEIAAFYNSLTTEQIREIAARYRADYLISQAEYPFPVVFTSGEYKIYQLERKP